MAVWTSRASSTKTRIETRRKFEQCDVFGGHQEQVPRKQGLKPLNSSEDGFHLRHQEQVPRKQGLKQDCSRALSPGKASRASSTKTRIETTIPPRWGVWAERHQEQVPRKQGLKPDFAQCLYCHLFHQEQVPRKQGLKPGETSLIRGTVISIKSKFHENKD